jgi:hypothetical protein
MLQEPSPSGRHPLRFPRLGQDPHPGPRAVSSAMKRDSKRRRRMKSRDGQRRLVMQLVPAMVDYLWKRQSLLSKRVLCEERLKKNEKYKEYTGYAGGIIGYWLPL